MAPSRPSPRLPAARAYDPGAACVFRSTKAPFGGLSNMAAGYPLVVGRAAARTSEALYQACRFPHHPEIQEAIFREASPMRAKMVSRKHTALTRPDWERARIPIMRWCLAVKLAQHFDVFGRLLESTGGRDIVEHSRRDDFWGAVTAPNGMLVGMNALGRLLMELRARYDSADRYALLVVQPLELVRFHLLGDPVPVVDGREMFLAYVRAVWSRTRLSLL